MKQPQIKVLLLLLLASLILMLADSQRILEPVKSVISVATVPTQFTLYRSKLALLDTLSFLTFWKSGEERIKNLEQRNLELAGYESKVKTLEKENEELRRQLGVNKVAVRKLLPAAVLGGERWLEIAAGEDSGVVVGQSVVYLDNLVGRVVKVGRSASFVQLPTDVEAKIPVKVRQTRGLSVGQFNSSLKLTQIAQNEVVATDDVVVTSGEGETYLPNLIVGRLGKMEIDATKLFKEAEIIPLVNYKRLTTVFVVLE